MKNLQEILIEVSKLVKSGYGEDVKNFINSKKDQTDDFILPKKLQDILDSIGDNPIDEKEVYELTLQIDKQEKSIIDLVLKYLSEDDMDEFDIDTIPKFAKKIVKKVTSFKDDDGVFKTTDNLRKWQPPKPSKIKKYEDLMKQAMNIEPDKALEFNAEVEDFILKSCNIDSVDNFTEWEKELVIRQSNEAFRGFYNSYMGKK